MTRPQSTAGSLKPIAVQQVTAPPLSEDATRRRRLNTKSQPYATRLLFVFENSMSSDLSSLLASSKALTSHLKRQDLPNVSLSLDQIEAQSRRLLPRQIGAQADTGRG
jgi:hypothetical protein